jgi:hypothetical protein
MADDWESFLTACLARNLILKIRGYWKLFRYSYQYQTMILLLMLF